MSSKGLGIDAHIRYAATTVGRDKVYRFVQYLSRFLAYYLAQREDYKDLAKRLSSLKSSIGLSRKLMRLGKPIEHLNTLVKSLSISDDVLRVLAVGRAASLAIYLFFDMLQWAHGAGLYKFQDVRSIGQKAARFWLIGLALNILAGIYRHRQISMRVDTTQKAIREQNRSGVVNETTRQELRNARKELSSTRRQLLQDCLDILIPSTTLNYTGLNDGLVGLAGTITSLMGIRSQWNKVCAK